MRKLKKICLAILISILTITVGLAQRKIIIQNPNEAQIIGRQIEVFEDKTAKLNFEIGRASCRERVLMPV